MADGVAPLCFFLASCLLYLINLDRAPHPDEIYHMLAARGLLEHGEPRIAEGLYERVYAHTWLVARSFELLGESLPSGRLPSVLAMALTNVLLFVWLRRQAGSLAAWLGAGLFLISPFAVDSAQFVRFYALQTLAFLAGCLLVQGLVPPTSRSWRAAIVQGLAACACFAFAVYLQPTTFLGLVGVGFWLVTAIGVPWLADGRVRRQHKLLAVALCLAAGLLILALTLVSGVLAQVWHLYRWTPVFNSENVNVFWFYHAFYLLFYPSLWPTIGLLALAGLALWPRATWFAAAIFATSFLLNSFAGPKALRYLAYAQPFLFIVIGLGLAAFLPWLRQAIAAFMHRLETQLAGLGRFGRLAPKLVLASALAVLVIGNAAFLRTATLLADITVPPDQPPILWRESLPAVEPALREADVVITMAELETLYFWERYDILFSPSRLSEMEEKHEFARDHRTGRPVISTTESLLQLLECTKSGLFVATRERWRQRVFIDTETANIIEQRMTRLELPANANLIVFAWEQPEPTSPASACATIHELLPAE